MSIVQAQKKRRGNNNEVAVRLPSSSIATSGPGSGLRALQEEDDEEPRTSSLQAPIMLLSGQDAPVYGVKFSPNGDVLASAGAEKAIYLWEVYGDCANYNVLRGHQNAILDLSFFRDGRTLATASADKSGALWDAHKGKRKRKLPCASIANGCCAGAMDDHVAVACDDGSVLLWDARQRKPAKQLQTQYALCAVALEGSENRVFAGGLDNIIRGWDLRTDEVVLELKGHSDTITGLSLSPDGSRLLSNSMDATLKAWDVAPFSPSERCVATFEGHSHDFHKNLLRCSWLFAVHESNFPARHRGDACSTAWRCTVALLPRDDLVKNYRAPDSLVDLRTGPTMGKRSHADQLTRLSTSGTWPRRRNCTTCQDTRAP